MVRRRMANSDTLRRFLYETNNVKGIGKNVSFVERSSFRWAIQTKIALALVFLVVRRVHFSHK